MNTNNFNQKNTFLGINSGSHDSSVAFFSVEKKAAKNLIVYSLERISKRKHDGYFPLKSLAICDREHPIEFKNLLPENVAINCFGEHPLEFEKKIENEKPHFIENIKDFGFQIGSPSLNPDINFITHHLAHAYSIFSQCPFDEALVIVSDSMGNDFSAFDENHPERSLFKESKGAETLTAYYFKDGRFTPIYKNSTFLDKKEDLDCHWDDGALGALYSDVSHAIFGDWMYSGKVMGLAAYGNASNLTQEDFLEKVKNKYKNKKDFKELNETEIKECADLAAYFQHYFEEETLKKIIPLKKQYPNVKNLVLVGGCALNCLLNSRIIRENIFEQVFIPPFPNDEGIALGAALALAHQKQLIEFKVTPYENMTPALGSLTHDVNKKSGEIYNLFSDYNIIHLKNDFILIAQLLNQGKIIAWMQGRSEVGPRALGFRSILGTPLKSGLKDYLNKHIKFREAFRPYGITILAEEVQNYFEVPPSYPSPFMTFAPQVKNSMRGLLKEVMHVDGTCRIQTLLQKQNKNFYSLIRDFQQISGVPLLLNTSLNIMGQPILESLNDALAFFKQSHIEYLVIGDILITKKES